LPDEALPKSEGMRRPYTNRKWFGEHLGPLKRWLRSNRGRSWNEVYSEACQVIKPSDPVRLHIKFHMLEMVERNTFLQEGDVWCHRRSQAVRLSDLGGHPIWPTFFIHPVTGLLLEVPSKPKRNRETRYRARPQHRWLKEFRLLMNLNGYWFECHLIEFPRHFEGGDSPLRYDLTSHRFIEPSRGLEIYGKRAYCAKKRQLSRKELKRFALRNSSAEDSSDLRRIHQYLDFIVLLLNPAETGTSSQDES
jgi:hypothetical protein